MKRKVVSMVLMACLAAGLAAGCGSEQEGNKASAAKEGDRTLTVFNYGEYMDPDVIAEFEEETGITVLYEEAVTPEEMYSKYSAGVIDYDLVCTTDYMIKKLMEDGELQEIDFDSMENASNIGDDYWEFAKAFDPENKYSMPYFWGTVGILYDTTRVTEPVTSWDVLFNGDYAGEIIMQDSMRDTFMVALKYLGYSMNTTDENELQEALELLKAQKPDVQAYLVDEVRDEIVAGNAIMGVIYSGEAYLGHEYNEDLAYVVPEEGSNIWMDSWAITKKCTDKEAAEQFLDFINRGDMAYKNFEYIYYSTPNEAAVDLMDEEFKNNEMIIPDMTSLQNCEVNTICDNEILDLYSTLWKELKAD